ncbi:MAG: hypothetical protein WDW36_006388 [Sanguina aurantia]
MPDYTSLKEVCLFLMAPSVLDPASALGLYVKAGTSEWLYRGCVHGLSPSCAMSLQWPHPEGSSVGVLPSAGAVQVGVSIEPLTELESKEGSRLGNKEEFVKRVATDLFRFIESFQTRCVGNGIFVPNGTLDKWLIRFTEKFRRDPDFLTRNEVQL